MTYATHHHELDRFFHGLTAGRGAAVNGKPGILRRVFDALVESRKRSADKEIARYFTRAGGMLTDNVEREMTERMMSNNWIARH